MNKYILALVSFSTVLCGSHQLMSMHFLDQESEQMQLNGGLLRTVSNGVVPGLDNDEDPLIRSYVLKTRREHVEVARRYLESGADINCVDNYDHTPS